METKKLLQFNLIIFLILLFLTSCKQPNKIDEKEKVLIERENELLKKENELSKKEQELSHKTTQQTNNQQKFDSTIKDKLDFLTKFRGIFLCLGYADQ